MTVHFVVKLLTCKLVSRGDRINFFAKQLYEEARLYAKFHDVDSIGINRFGGKYRNQLTILLKDFKTNEIMTKVIFSIVRWSCNSSFQNMTIQEVDLQFFFATLNFVNENKIKKRIVY